MHDTDVAVIGFGPVGQLLTRLLGRLGVRAMAFERAAGPFAAPRAAVTDDACQRILARAGVDPPLHVPGSVAMVTAGGRVLPILDPGRGEVPALVSFDQVELERSLSAAAAEVAADVRFGAAVESVSPDGVVRLAGGEVVRAAWVVACDGARSAVRRDAGIAFGGSTYAQPWLVVDAEVDEPVTDGVRFVADPARPAVTLPLAPGLHRWEFMLDGRDVPDWQPLVARWTDPARLRPRRVAVYTYHARVAARWRAGRVLLCGDAAHVMPPFAGQGLSAGLRDADNLAWKLAAVLRGAPEELLDTYESERRPEVVRSSLLARFMGAVLQTRRARLASVRDAAFTGVSATPGIGPWFAGGGLRPAPTLGRGAVAAEPPTAHLRPGPPRAGGLAPTALDRVHVGSWLVAGRRPVPAWELLGVPFAPLDLPRPIVVRPDRYVYATRALDRAASDYAARWRPRR